MKTYVIVTGIIFGLLTIVHVWRMIVESSSLRSDPHFIILTVLAGLLSVWSVVVLRRTPPRT
jgi:hypothetical protein